MTAAEYRNNHTAPYERWPGHDFEVYQDLAASEQNTALPTADQAKEQQP